MFLLKAYPQEAFVTDGTITLAMLREAVKPASDGVEALRLLFQAFPPEQAYPKLIDLLTTRVRERLVMPHVHMVEFNLGSHTSNVIPLRCGRLPQDEAIIQTVLDKTPSGALFGLHKKLAHVLPTTRHPDPSQGAYVHPVIVTQESLIISGYCLWQDV